METININAEQWFKDKKMVFRGINAGEYLDKEDFLKFANWQKEQDKAIIVEFEKMKREFYVNICRAYNAGKQNMGETINDEKKFISSHAYFVNEFPEFKNYIP